MKNLKVLALTAAVATASFGSVSVAQAEVAENLSVTSNYLWRGTSLGDADVQGGLDWTGGSGLYAGGWVSGAANELDMYAGWKAGMFDLGAIKYYYTRDEAANVAEVYAGVTVSAWTAKLYVDVAGDDNGNNMYFEVIGDLGPVNINAGMNMNDVDATEYAQLTLGYTHKNLTFAVALTDIDDLDEEISVTYSVPFE